MSIRIERINSEIQKYVAEIFRGKMSEYTSGSMVSVTRVETAKDLKHCKIYISIYGGDKAQIFSSILKMNGFIRYELASMLKNLRCIPELHFVLDESLDHSQKINQLIENLKKND